MQNLVALGDAVSHQWESLRIRYKRSSSNKAEMVFWEDHHCFDEGSPFHALVVEHGFNPLEFVSWGKRRTKFYVSPDRLLSVWAFVHAFADEVAYAVRRQKLPTLMAVWAQRSFDMVISCPSPCSW